ncbi:MAG: hypothetical protein OXF93_13210 [Acidobacteria bacterium]|nr:hypothetical protein [Acidobacteriota bacterium]
MKKKTSLAVSQQRPAGRRTGALILNAEDRSISIDMSKLGPPQRTYDADLASLEHREGDIRLFFGKLKLPERTALATRVEIRYPIESFHQHLWHNSRKFHEVLRGRAAGLIFRPPDQRQLHTLIADRDHSEWANFDFMGYSGTEAAIDFFHLPPTDIARFAKTGASANIGLEPILRVQLGVDQLLGLLESCAESVPEIEKYLRRGPE